MPLAPKAPDEVLSVYFAFLHLISGPRAAKRVFGPALRAFPVSLLHFNDVDSKQSPQAPGQHLRVSESRGRSPTAIRSLAGHWQVCYSAEI